MPKLWVYVSGPYTKDDPVVNTRAALDAGTLILNAGHVPIIPHLSLLWHLIYPRPWGDWIEYDLELIKRCDVLVRLPGESRGADLEVAFAERLQIPIIFSPAKDIDWSKMPCN